jgi:hypothetical protein
MQPVERLVDLEKGQSGLAENMHQLINRMNTIEAGMLRVTLKPSGLKICFPVA